MEICSCFMSRHQCFFVICDIIWENPVYGGTKGQAQTYYSMFMLIVLLIPGANQIYLLTILRGKQFLNYMFYVSCMCMFKVRVYVLCCVSYLSHSYR